MILSAVSAKVWQVIAFGTLGLALVAGTGWRLQTWRLGRAVSSRVDLSLERDNWRRASDSFEFANSTWAGLAKKRADLIAADRAAAATAAKAAADRVQAAKAAERQAERRLTEFQQRPRTTTCSAALATLETACPELRGF